MAAIAPTAAQLELISSLAQEEIPIKLRCAICSRLAVNAFRLPCCDQAICETCQSTLPSSCPVCEHSPVAADDCKPNKSLRTTIRVFLRTEEKKREAQKVKELKNTPPITPVQEVPVEAPVHEVATIPEPQEASFIEPLDSEVPVVTETAADSQTVEEQQDIPQPSIEEIAPGQEESKDGVDVSNSEAYGDAVQAAVAATEKAMEGNVDASGAMQLPGFGVGFPMDPSAAGGFPNMGMMGQGADFNQMQMMMAMQNGMMPNAFSGFPMGMPGMSMDPMAMQNMFMNGGYGAQGMGMNMNMGAGMAGYDGGVGTGFNNGWNGQQSWNMGQDNFNPLNAAGLGHGDFGANNSGFNRQNATGFNQGNYGRQNQYNDFQQNNYGHQGQGFYPRGRGRGRGFGQARGGQGYGSNDFNSQQYANGSVQPFEGQMKEASAIPAGPRADLANAPDANVDEFGREIREKPTEEDSLDEIKPLQGDQVDRITEDATELKHDHEQEQTDQHTQQEDPQQATEAGPALTSRFSKTGFTEANQGGKPISVYESMPYNRNAPSYVQQLPVVADIPFNAPKGPKAMREGLPNTSLVHLRGRGGFSSIGRGPSRSNGNNNELPVASVKSRTASPVREVEEEKDRERDVSAARSEQSDDHERRRERHRERKSHRQRSVSMSDDGKEEERRRERRRRHSRKYDDESDAAVIDSTNVLVDDARSPSPNESPRSSYRSRRDKDGERDSGKERHRSRDRAREKDRERNEDKDKDATHKHRSSHRSNRDRSRSPHHSHRDRDRSRERRHRRRHDSAEPSRETSRDREDRKRRDKHRERGEEQDAIPEPKEPTPTPLATKSEIPMNIPRGPRAMSNANMNAHNTTTNGSGIGIKGASSRRPNTQDENNERVSDPRPSARRDHDRERSSRHSRDEQRSSVHTESKGHEQRPSVSGSASAKAPAKSAVDPHTLEREARNRERLLKEAQRMATISGGGAGRKRSRDEGDGAASKGRKKGRRSEGVSADGGLEERIAKGESERESARWS